MPKKSCLSGLVVLMLNLGSGMFGGLTLIRDLLYPHSYSSHPLLSNTVDQDVLVVYGLLSVLGIACSGLALAISLMMLTRKRHSQRKTKVLILFLLLSMVTLFFCSQRYRFLSALDLSKI